MINFLAFVPRCSLVVYTCTHSCWTLLTKDGSDLFAAKAAFKLFYFLERGRQSLTKKQLYRTKVVKYIETIVYQQYTNFWK